MKIEPTELANRLGTVDDGKRRIKDEPLHIYVNVALFIRLCPSDKYSLLDISSGLTSIELWDELL